MEGESGVGPDAAGEVPRGSRSFSDAGSHGRVAATEPHPSARPRPVDAHQPTVLPGTAAKPDRELAADDDSLVPEPVAHVPEQPNATRRPWLRRFRVTLILVDLLSAAGAGLVALEVRFGDVDRTTTYAHGGLLPWVLSLPLVWVALLGLGRAYDARVIGVGAVEFQRVWRCSVYLTALIAVTAYLSKTQVSRGFVLVVVPLMLLYTTLGRYGARRVLHSLRRRGVGMTRVLVLGDAERAVELAEEMVRDAYAGLCVVGACLTTEDENPAVLKKLQSAGISVVGDLDDLPAAARRLDADAVAVTASHGLGARKLRWISWQLEGTGIDLLVAPGLIEVTGRRLHVRQLSVVPLLQVESPRFSGFARLVKGAFDRTAAATALVLLAPLMLVLGVLVRCTSPGPALFRQTRVGQDGRTFTMVKFRSMYADAEQRLAELADANVHRDGVLFKIPDDPRVTPVGRFLRKYSLDELPQLFNVLLGSMSLVGPRPPLPREVARYGDDVRRRLLVKPGVTGLWQISGRSDLSWEESVRLDLRYVENWSLANDIEILWKTGAAVLRSSGAY